MPVRNQIGENGKFTAKAHRNKLTPTLENVRCWVENTRMRPDEVEDSVRESYELAQTFQTIGDLLKNEIMVVNQQTDTCSDGN